MLIRQKIILKLLKAKGGSCSKLELTKLSFLLSENGLSEQLKTFYEFVPYKFGPHSFTMAHELRNLVKDGCIKSTDSEIIELTDKGKKLAVASLEPRLSRDIELLEQHHGGMKQNQLLDFVYKKYPWFTANSHFPEKRKAVIATVPCANYTIGYQSFQVDGLLNKLLQSGIRLLIDTRSNPVSRRYGFHKSSLSSLAENVGIKYLHEPEAGIPSLWRQDLNSESEYKALFLKYEKEILGKDKSLIKRLASLMTEQPTALLCRESDAHHCHRSSLAKALSKQNKLPSIELSSPETPEDMPLFKFNNILMK